MRGYANVIYFNFTKVFYKVSDNILIDKLKIPEIVEPENLLVISEVPQKSFNFLINDLSSSFVNSMSLLFVDDDNIFLEIKNVSLAILLQNDLDNFDEWCLKKMLSISINAKSFGLLKREIQFFTIINSVTQLYLL